MDNTEEKLQKADTTPANSGITFNFGGEMIKHLTDTPKQPKNPFAGLLKKKQQGQQTTFRQASITPMSTTNISSGASLMKAEPLPVAKIQEPTQHDPLKRIGYMLRAKTPEHISNGLKDPHYVVQMTAVENAHASPEHITQALQAAHPSVREAAAKKASTPEHFQTAMNDPNPKVRHALLQNSRTPENHRQILMKDKASHDAGKQMSHELDMTPIKKSDAPQKTVWYAQKKGCDKWYQVHDLVDSKKGYSLYTLEGHPQPVHQDEITDLASAKELNKADQSALQQIANMRATTSEPLKEHVAKPHTSPSIQVHASSENHPEGATVRQHTGSDYSEFHIGERWHAPQTVNEQVDFVRKNPSYMGQYQAVIKRIQAHKKDKSPSKQSGYVYHQ